MSFEGARIPDDFKVPVHAIDSQIFHMFGVELITLARVTDEPRTMVCKVETGSFRIKIGVGDTDDALAAPTETDVENGGGSVQFVVTDGIFYLSRANVMSFQGEGASDILTFWFI